MRTWRLDPFSRSVAGQTPEEGDTITLPNWYLNSTVPCLTANPQSISAVTHYAHEKG